MDADGQEFQENEHAASSAERRSGTERRSSSGRRRSDLACATPNTSATSAPKEPKRVRKFYFRSFEDRRGSIDRRAGDPESGFRPSSPDADDDHPG